MKIGEIREIIEKSMPGWELAETEIPEGEEMIAVKVARKNNPEIKKTVQISEGRIVGKQG